MLILERGSYKVTRFCCQTAHCLECVQRGTHGQLRKRRRILQMENVSKDCAEQIARLWAHHSPKVEEVK